ncbi:MAG: hypothetical protein P8X94_11940, partial [Woeseiaceae bacterium]
LVSCRLVMGLKCSEILVVTVPRISAARFPHQSWLSSEAPRLLCQVRLVFLVRCGVLASPATVLSLPPGQIVAAYLAFPHQLTVAPIQNKRKLRKHAFCADSDGPRQTQNFC